MFEATTCIVVFGKPSLVKSWTANGIRTIPCIDRYAMAVVKSDTVLGHLLHEEALANLFIVLEERRCGSMSCSREEEIL